ncbi:MAG: helicase-related protein [Chloroflexi bacterium]|nr:helicase-related protein [Chloroflexota bacterium]
MALRTGDIRGVVATNALELGIDIGELDAAVLTGYPGSIASTWQQIGRAGRRTAQSAAVMIASNNPLDQYICNHPRYLFGQSPEHALTNPDNLRIMVRHLQCAAYELPFRKDETYGSEPVGPLLDVLEEKGILHQTRDQFHYVGKGLQQRPFPCAPAATTTSSCMIWATSWTRPRPAPSVKWTWNAPPPSCMKGLFTCTWRKPIWWKSWIGTAVSPTCAPLT